MYITRLTLISDFVGAKFDGESDATGRNDPVLTMCHSGRELPCCEVCERTSQVCEYPAQVLKPGPKIGILLSLHRTSPVIDVAQARRNGVARGGVRIETATMDQPYPPMRI